MDLSDQLSNLSHDKKWDVLKPELEGLYHEQRVPEIASVMRAKYGFDANVPAYKYRFKIWGWKKNIPKQKKKEILDLVHERTVLGKRSLPIYNGVAVDSKRLKRYVTTMSNVAMSIIPSWQRDVDQQARILGPFLPFGSRPFANWNMSFKNILLQRVRRSTSPLTISQVQDIQVTTPSHSGDSSYEISSPGRAPSPLTAAVSNKVLVDRAVLFVQGRYHDLLTELTQAERSDMSEWLHQFWQFSFGAATSWGQTASDWATEHTEIETYDSMQPSASEDLSGIYLSHNQPSSNSATDETALRPSALCNWTEHVEEYEVVEVDDPPLEKTLAESLESNSFSSIPTTNLPLSISYIAKAVQRSEDVLQEEALAFAIMARNVDLVYDIVGQILLKNDSKHNERILRSYPVHMAASYLDGSKTCCNIMAIFVDFCLDNYSIFKDTYTNSYGHTILDNLMLAILRSHSTAPLQFSDEDLGHQARYAGTEVDICGRWDADSSCFRALQASGQTRLPPGWKHKFCHTSVQAVCHSIFVLNRLWLVETSESGLFVKLCSHCGKRLRLKPLHTLVMVAFGLANHGCQDEDLFGILACYFQLVDSRCDPRAEADISIDLLLGRDDGGNACSHELTTPTKLMELLYEDIDKTWSPDLKNGWELVYRVSQMAEAGRNDCEHAGRKTLEAYEQIRDCYYDGSSSFGTDTRLGSIWAAIQTELLNYRRSNEGDPWLSQNFDTVGLLVSLQTGADLKLGYLVNDLMEPYCPCGRFNGMWMPTRKDATANDCSNMDCRDRGSLICEPQVYFW